MPVLANDFNPFPETPLKLLSANVETGGGSASVEGDQVVVTPSADFVGTLVVRYRIQDATEDPDREATGQVVLTVQGVPAAPGAPTVTSVQDRTVVVSYGAPSNNGAEITKYTVSSVQGSAYSKECQSTTCTLDGLTNNVEYVFQVTATNRVGESEPSGSSPVARPDARPDTPNPPTLKFGDKSLQVTWTTPTTPGSPVERYTLRDLARAAVGDHAERGHRQLPHLGGPGERRQLPGAGAGAQPRSRAVELEQLVGLRGARRAAAGRLRADDSRAGAGRQPGADAGELGDAAGERRRDRRVPARGVGGIHACRGR